MFKKSSTNKQFDLFNSPSDLMCGRESRQYDAPSAMSILKEGSGWRYFGRDQIEKAKIRREVESIPFDERKKRNNVEATIFQYCFHTRNNKTRYRTLFKHKLQAVARCAWINVRRLLLFDLKMALQRA